jgi:hypothetical protein
VLLFLLFSVVKIPSRYFAGGEVAGDFFFFGCKIPSRKIAGGEDGEQEFMIMSVVLTCGIVLEQCSAYPNMSYIHFPWIFHS